MKRIAFAILLAFAALSVTTAAWAVLIIGALFALLVASGGGTSLLFALLIMAGVGTYFYLQYQNLDQRRTQARTKLETERDDASRRKS